VVLAAALLYSGRPVSSTDPALARQATRPDIVLILTDDQRYDQLQSMPQTRSLLGDQGVTFSNSYIVNPLCCPSRATILTGQDSGHTDVWNNDPPDGGFATFSARGEEAGTIAAWLHAAGYLTSLDGKYLNGYLPGDTTHVPAGWDDWHALALHGGDDGVGGYLGDTTSENGLNVLHGSTDADYSTDVLAGDADRFIRDADPARSLFVYYAPRAPHAPATPPARYTGASACDGVGAPRAPSFNEADVSDKPAYLQAIPPLRPRRVKRLDGFVHQQCETLLAVDDAVAEIVAALRDTGRLDNTLIMFQSDNGLLSGEHRWASKNVAYEESIHVPTIIRYDPLTAGLAGSSDSHLVLNLDDAPTFAAAAGVSPPAGVQGQDILDLFTGDGTGWRQSFLVEHDRTNEKKGALPPYCGIHTSNDLYVQYATGEQEYYDLSLDPFELDSAASAPANAEIVASLHDQAMSMCNPLPPSWSTFAATARRR
jgi:arylsulfatase A-like enzyme